MWKKEFMELKAEWDKKLKESGFHDIEDLHGRLKSHDIRTKAFIDRNAILEFFLALDTYLEQTKDLPSVERRILELYSCGIHIKQIAIKLDLGRTKIKDTIRKYRLIVLNIRR